MLETLRLLLMSQAVTPIGRGMYSSCSLFPLLFDVLDELWLADDGAAVPNPALSLSLLFTLPGRQCEMWAGWL